MLGWRVSRKGAAVLAQTSMRSGASMSGELYQRAVDSAYEMAGMPAVLTDSDMNFLAASVHPSGSDANRLVTVLERRIQPGGKTLASDLQFATRDSPFTLLPRREFGMHDRRLGIPIRSAGRSLGYLWVLQAANVDRSDSLRAVAHRIQGDLELVSSLSDRGLPILNPQFWATGAFPEADGVDHGRAPWMAASAYGYVVVFREFGSSPTTKPDRDTFERWLGERCVAWSRSAAAHIAVVEEGKLSRVLEAHRAIGISQPGDLTVHSAMMLGQADFASRVAVVSPTLERVTWSTSGIWHLAMALSELPDSIPPAVEELGAIAPELVDTALHYLDAAGSMADLAAALHIHRSTLYYRLSKIEEALGEGWSIGSARTMTHLGLLLWKVGNVAPLVSPT
jgi:hypothetical protein